MQNKESIKARMKFHKRKIENCEKQLKIKDHVRSTELFLAHQINIHNGKISTLRWVLSNDT